MTARVASPGPMTLIARREPAQPPAMASCATAPAGGGTDGTPFYDRLMSMIDATALENRRAQQVGELDALPPPADGHGWPIGHLIAGAAVLILVAALGGIVAGLRAGQSGPPVVTADAAPVKTSLMAARATASEAPAEAALPAAKPDGASVVGLKGAEATKEHPVVGDTDAASAAAAKPHEPPQAQPADGPAVEVRGSGAKTADDATESPPAAAKAAPGEVVAPAEAPAAKKRSVTFVTGSIGTAPAALRTARMLSDANMRAGPGMSQTVLAAIPRGAAVEVLSCRHWCEVIFAEQRGWVYKSFIGPSKSAQGL